MTDVVRPASHHAFSAYGRQGILIGSVAYTFLYVQLYAVMAQFWDYLGFTSLGYGGVYRFLPYLLVGLASFGVRTDRRTIGEFIVNSVFFILYVPCITTPFLQGTLDPQDALASGILLAVSFLFVSWLVHRHREAGAAAPVHQLLEPEIFWIGLFGLWGALNVYVLLVFWGNLRLTGLSDIYEQRFLADSVGGGGLVFYAILNLAGGLNPLLLALGLRRKSLGLVGMAITSQFLMYSTSALKAILASVILIVALHFALGAKARPRTFLVLPGLLAITLVGVIFSPFYEASAGLLDQMISLMFMRTTMTPGVIYGVYLDFFSVYPTTHFSHVSIVRLVVPYPYGLLQVGQIVGQHMVQNAGIEVINVNASYLSTDGIASFWLAGIPMIGLISAIVFRFIDRLLGHTDPHLACVALLAVLIYLSNVSLFTATTTYGGFIVVALLWLIPRSNVVLDRDRGWQLG